MRSASELLPIPGDEKLEGTKMLVQERIHGHRFIPEQEPYMIVLETLSICNSVPLGTEEARSGRHEDFTYELPHRRKMRFLLFQDHNLELIANLTGQSSLKRWKTWKTLVNQDFGTTANGQDQFSYLDQAFGQDIESLWQAVRLLRSREVDISNDRRWSSRFLAITGPNMICADMRESKQGLWTGDRRFFGRGGELVYLMLNRSTFSQELGVLVRDRLLASSDHMDRVAAALSDRGISKSAKPKVGYLPFLYLDSYDRIARDWMSILELNGLPNDHLFEPLFRITGLNLLVYLAERSKAGDDPPEPTPIVADLTNGANAYIRADAKRHLNYHRVLANTAVRRFITDSLDASEIWKSAVSSGRPDLARDAIFRCFSYESKYKNDKPSKQRDVLIQEALARSSNNIHKYLLPLAKGSGLADSRGPLGPWFSLSDAMLFALVVSNTEQSMELREFLLKLYKRYGLVIGPHEARLALGEIHSQRFEENISALVSRLSRLGFTKRLSDDCVFVTHPYRKGYQT